MKTSFCKPIGAKKIQTEEAVGKIEVPTTNVVGSQRGAEVQTNEKEGALCTPSDKNETEQSASEEASNTKTTVTAQSHKNGNMTTKEVEEEDVDKEEKATESPGRTTNKAKEFWITLPQRRVQINQRKR